MIVVILGTVGYCVALVFSDLLRLLRVHSVGFLWCIGFGFIWWVGFCIGFDYCLRFCVDCSTSRLWVLVVLWVVGLVMVGFVCLVGLGCLWVVS